MQSKAITVKAYLDELPEDRIKPMMTLRKIINKNLPKGFQECMNYGMIGWVVPFSLYAEGYHCTPELPLPFLALASQKNFIALYHMGIYTDKKIYDWFTKSYAAKNIGKLDMGKSCIRFKNMDKIPYELLGDLVSKMTVQQWIDIYDKAKPKK